MTKKERLYSVLGDLLYAVAMADGIIQPEEKDALKTFFKDDALGSEVIWSFEYNEQKNYTVEEMYNKARNFCHSYGPAKEYQDFIHAMKVIALASKGYHEKETEMIQSFSKDLLERFQRDTDKLREHLKPDA